MALEAKAMLMGEMERDLSDKLTAADISTVMSIMADHLARYNMERTGGAEYEDDLLDAYLSALEVQGRSPLTIDLIQPCSMSCWISQRSNPRIGVTLDATISVIFFLTYYRIGYIIVLPNRKGGD